MRSVAPVIAATLTLWATSAVFALDVPRLDTRINDRAALISPPAEARIEEHLAKLERETGAQLVIVTLESLEGEQLEDYAHRAFETWKLGRADSDDGVLLLIAKNERQMRIEVGYGLEPTLTDVMSKRVLDQIMRPRFRAGDFDGGVERAVDAIDGIIRGTSTLPPPPPGTRGGEMPPRLFGMLWLLFLIPFVLVVVATNPFQWFLYLFLLPFVFVGGMTAIGPSAAPLFAACWLLGAPVVWWFVGRRRKRQTKSARGRRSGWAGGAWSSSGGWSSGGGFSGGGGSSGGGGASSSW